MQRMVHAIIFDMDGVIVDNDLYHVLSWRSFFEKHNKKLKESELLKWIFGRTNIETIKYVFGDGISIEDMHRLAAEKEKFYRQLYSKKIKARDGLIDFLKNVKSNNIKTGIATSAPKKNVDFVLDSLAIRKYFDIIVDDEKVKKSKPAPDVYITVAKYLKVKCNQCVVFEDSISGIEAARSAQMFVISVPNTYERQNLKHAQYSIKDFRGLTTKKIDTLYKKIKYQKTILNSSEINWNK